MNQFEHPHHLHHPHRSVAEVVDDLDGDATRAVDLIGFSEGDLVLEKKSPLVAPDFGADHWGPCKQGNPIFPQQLNT